jgi:monothiol glutaredoxin
MAFRIDNPGEPPKVRQLSVQGLAERRAAEDCPRLIDVRTPGEWQTARIEGAELLNSDLMDELSALPKNTPLIFMCHHGHRSQRVAEQMNAEGFTEVYNLRGGIDAWSTEIDPSVPRY